MPQSKSKRKYGIGYTYDMLKEAYNDVTTKNIQIRRAAKLHNMPESTLRYRLKHPDGTDVKSGGSTIFTRQQEEKLAEHCVTMAHLGYGFARWQVLEMTKNMCEILGKDDVQPSKHWFYGFLGRFPEIKMTKPKKREMARDVAVTDGMLSSYFEELKMILEKYDIMNKPQHIWNVDESCISLDHNPPKVLARAGTNPHAVTHGKSATTTLIAAGSAIGETVPPYIIFKGERISKDLKSSGIQGTEYRTSPTGWSNSVLFLDFFQNHFLKHVITRPCLLLYDGHSTHISIDVIETARKNDVHLFVLPPHRSHCLQPLDVSVFSPFKCSLNTQIHRHMHNNPSTVITTRDLPGFIGSAYKASLTVSTIMSGFRKTGIFPFDPTAPSVKTPTITKMTTSKTASRSERIDNRKVKILFEEKSSEFSATQKVEVQKKRKSFVPPFGCAISEDVQYERKKELQKTSEKEKEQSMTGTRKRKAFKAPYKDSINRNSDNNYENDSVPKKSKEGQEKEITKERKGKGPYKNSKKGKNPCKRPVAKEPEQDNLDVDEDDLCIVCKKWQPDALRLQTSIKFVDWGQCTACCSWVHLKFCSAVEHLSENDSFLCPRCAPES